MSARGSLYTALSALLFALSTVFAKIVIEGSRVPAIELTFFRFAAGFAIVGSYALFTGKGLRPVAPRFILSRSIFNTCAVVFFFMALEHSSVTKVNMMNMTYPVFVFILAPLINREGVPPSSILSLAAVMAGIFLVTVPAGGLTAFSSVNKGDVYALVSSFFAAFAIVYLRESVKYDANHVILFYLMGLGALITGAVTIPVFVMPRGEIALHAALATAAAVAGQFFITEGQHYLDAAPASLISTSRIIFAMALGWVIFGDCITPRILAGASLIVFSILSVTGILKRL